MLAMQDPGAVHLLDRQEPEPMRLDKELGISYRQIDWWEKCGYVHRQPSDSGFTRTFSEHEKAIAKLMGRLVKVGFTAHAAARIARTAVDLGEDAIIELGDNIELQVPLNEVAA
jgi:DNA-binding transcriptional MerR regulator